VRPRRPNRRLPPLPAWLGALALGVALAPAPAGAAQKVPQPKPAAVPGSLDLRLPSAAILLPPERGPRGRGYAARLREDPWSVLADDPPPAAGPAIPRVRDGERLEDEGEVEELSLRGLLDGQTFPILTIRLSPEP
jgi:hypothetical protein